MTSFMASQTLLFQPSLLVIPVSQHDTARFNFRVRVSSRNLDSQISTSPALRYSRTLASSPFTLRKSKVSAFASAIGASAQSSLTGSTRSLTTLFALALSLSSFFLKLLQKIPLPIPSPEQLAAIRSLQSNDLYTSSGPLFFAAIRDRPTGLNTPLTVVAAGLSKWLDIYSGVLVIRVLLSWFPNIPWDRQPLSAIRDLCDPYLSLFRNIIPPVFNTLDISPIFAFTVLGMLGSILNSTRSM